MSSGRPDALIARLASERDGVFDRRDAHRCGLTDDQIRNRVRRGLWLQLLPGVYKSAATPESLAGLRRAALLWAGDDAALSHRSAGALWQLDGVSDPRPELIVPSERHPRSGRVIVHRSNALGPHDFARREGLRCTTPTRTLIDLAGVLDEEALEIALESARRMRLVTVASVRARLEPIAGRGRPGASSLRGLLDLLDGRAPAEYTLEVKTARLLRRTTLPEPVRQHRIRVFGRVYRLDFAWPHWRIALECDSRAFHEFQRDRTRWRQLGASGWRVLPVTWKDVTRDWPAVLSELETALLAAA